jgi:CBS domain-containing protein
MQCAELMNKNVECITPESTVEDAARVMRQRNIGFLPVCDADGFVLGALTDRDLTLRVLAEKRPGSTLVREVMSREVVAVRAREPIQTAQQLMGLRRKSRIMCLDTKGKLVGVISLSDLAHHTDAHSDGEGVINTLRQVTLREARVL